MPVIYPPVDQWVWLVLVMMMGGCIGSFLNVVIYRVPLGMSVNKPNRSFCPLCKNQLTMLQNLPILSWFILRGKCGHCKEPIPFRYILVEIVTALLFGGVWWFFSESLEVVVFLWVLMALLVAITWIDAAHLIIPTNLTWAGSVVGIGACFAWPQISALAGFNESRLQGFYDGALGWAFGFVGLWVVVELGKKAFGKKEMKFDKEVEWHLAEPEGDEDPMLFVIGGEAIEWWDIFSRDSDRLLVDATEVTVDGEATGGGQLVIRAKGIELADGRSFELEKMVSLSGRARGAVVPREAMGMGDVHLLAMLGAFFGAAGVFFSLFAASLFAIVAALVGRIGFGKQLPFGPFLAMGGVVWMFGGWKIWQWYMSLVG